MSKTLHTFLAGVIIICLVFGCGIQSLAYSEVSVSVEKIGTFDPDSIPGGSYYDFGSCFSYRDEGYVILSLEGKNELGTAYYNVFTVSGSDYLIVETLDDENYVHPSLVKPDGTVYISEVNDIIQYNNRFLRIKNADGTCVMYDLENDRLVDEIQVDSAGSIGAVGNSILAYIDDGYSLFDADGNEIAEIEGRVDTVFEDCFSVYKNSGLYFIYDDELNTLAKVDFEPNKVYGEAEAFMNYDHELLDAEGNKITDLEFNWMKVCELDDGLALYNDEDGTLTTIDFAGNAIDSAENVTYVFDTQDAYHNYSFKTENGEGEICSDGTIVFADEAWGAAALRGESRGECDVYIHSDGDFSLHLTRGDILANGDSILVYDMDDEGHVALYDVLNGELLIDYDSGYTGFRNYENGYFSAVKDGVWDIYKVVVE